jgi:hypothetical protein
LRKTLSSQQVLHARDGVDLARDDDDGDVRQLGVVAHLLEHPDASEIRHHQVEQHQRRVRRREP